MRSLLFLLLLFFISLPLAFGQQQYTEGACILLHQQMQRFSHNPQSSNYRNAMREYDRFCQKPKSPFHVDTATRQRVEPTAQTVPEAKVEVVISPSRQPEPEAPLKLKQPLLAETTESIITVSQPSVEPDNATDQSSVNSQALPVVDENNAPADPIIFLIINNLPLIIANVFAFLLAIFLLTTWLGWNLPGFKGVFAEYKLNRLLRWRFSRGYHHFRKIKMLTAKDELVIIDHLVLSPFGIFVIMVKDYRGQIFGSETEANWMRQYLGTNKQFMNPLHENFKHVEAVKNLLQLLGTDATQHVYSVIAFSRVAQFKTEMPANITYLDEVSAYLKQFDEPCFGDEQISRFSALLKLTSIEI